MHTNTVKQNILRDQSIIPDKSVIIVWILWICLTVSLLPLPCTGQTQCGSHSLSADSKEITFSTPNHPVPDEWIAKVKAYDYTSPPGLIIEEFQRIIHKEPKEHGSEGYFTSLFVNLDNESDMELLAFIGWEWTDTQFCVFKRIDNVWRLLYTEHVSVHYKKPRLYIANTDSPCKVFYIRQFYNGGTGIYKEKYHIFRLINQTVYPCLRIIKNAHISAWPLLFIGERIYSRLSIAGEDSIQVHYTYRFHPDMALLSQAAKLPQRQPDPTTPHAEQRDIDEALFDRLYEQDIAFIDDDALVYYTWDPQTKQYEFDWSVYDKLNICQIARFGDFNNDQLFIEVFEQELLHVQEHGSFDQRLLLNTYFDAIKE